MNGFITRKTLIRHPLLIVELWGWKNLIAGLLYHGTFLAFLQKRGLL